MDGAAAPRRAVAVAPDGSPVAVFRALPPEPAASYVAAAVPAGADVLDLGCGAGRLAMALAARGHRVVGVDISPAMLAGVAVPVVAADAAAIRLRHRFGAVVLASYLVNHPTLGGAFLDTCAAHVAPEGSVIVQRYDEQWVRHWSPDVAHVGNVAVSVRTLSLSHDRFTASVRYELEGAVHHQRVDAVLVDDDRLDRLAEVAGLRVVEWLDAYRTWARLAPRS